MTSSPRLSSTKLPSLGSLCPTFMKINHGNSTENFEDSNIRIIDGSPTIHGKGDVKLKSLHSCNNGCGNLLEIGHRCSIDNIINLGAHSVDSDKSNTYVKTNSVTVNNESLNTSDTTLKMLIEKIMIRNAEKKEHFIRHVFHEIRTPLHVLSNYLSSFSFPSLEEQREMRHHISTY